MKTTQLETLTAASGTAGGPTMRAVVQDRYGPAPEAVLRLAQINRPAIGDDEVQLTVHAAGLDFGTWHMMAGLVAEHRAAGLASGGPE
jgi:NADPH:quinone reductase-like Zn-dependent oxidoreductase